MRAELLAATSGDQTAAFAGPPRSGGSTEQTPRVAVGGDATTRSEPWRIAGILVLVALAVVVALLLPSLFGDERIGPLPRPGGGDGGGANAPVLRIREARDFDPEGDGTEHSEVVALAHDGDPSTAWTTENYDDPLSVFKSGVGLVFDLGDVEDVSEVDVTGCPGCGLEIRAGDQEAEDIDAFEPVDETDEAAGTETFDGGTGRFWVVLITDFQGGGPGRGTIAEVEFRGS